MTGELNIHDESLHRAAREIFNITSHELSQDEINLIRYGKENVHYIRDCANNKIVQIAPLTGSQPPNTLVTTAENNSTEEKQMTAQAISSKSPVFLAAQESETLDIIEDLLLNVPHDTSLTDDLILTIQAYIASEGKDGNKSHDELGQLARKAKMWGVFKLCGQVKGSDAFQNLIAKHTPALEVTGGNQMGTVVATGTTAAEVVAAPKPQKPAKGGKGTKAAKEKAPKKEKVAKTPKVKPALPLPTIADISALESLDRKSLQGAIMAVNSQGITTGVNGKSSSDAIKVALAKELLGVEGYVPPTLSKEEKKYSIRLTRKRADGTHFTVTQSKSDWQINVLDGLTSFEAHVKVLIEKGGVFELKNEKGVSEVILELVTSTAKASKGKSAKAPESPLAMPEGICWDEVKGMSYRQLQQFCKVLRSNGLFEGNVGGAGSGKAILLEKVANAMRKLGHDIQGVQVSPQNPDTATPTLERKGVKYDLHCQATALLAA